MVVLLDLCEIPGPECIDIRNINIVISQRLIQIFRRSLYPLVNVHSFFFHRLERTERFFLPVVFDHDYFDGDYFDGVLSIGNERKRCRRINIVKIAMNMTFESAAYLLRNYRLNDVARLSVDESETEVSGALGQAAHGTGAILSVVGGGPGVLIDEPILESAVDENGELSSGGGDGFGFTDAIGETSIVGAESGLCTPEAECAMRRMPAARFAEGCVFELRSRPPEILLLGARVSQEVKCFSVGHRFISVPISASKRSAE